MKLPRPELHSGHIRVRPVDERDASAMFDLAQNNTTELASDGTAPTLAELTVWAATISRAEGRYDFSIVDTSSDTYLGAIVLYDVNATDETVKLGVCSLPRQRDSRMVRAVELVVDAAFQQLGLHRIEIEVLATDGTTSALAKELGMTLDGRMREAHVAATGKVDVLVFSRLATDPRPALVTTSDPDRLIRSAV